MAITIENFRAEYGVRLDTLAEVTGISAETLASCESVLPVPPQIAQIIIEKYNLPPYYFTGVSLMAGSEEKVPYKLDKFIVPSFVWLLATSLIASLPSFIGSMMISLSTVISLADRHDIAINAVVIGNVVSLISAIWGAMVIIISCNFFSKWLEKKFGFSADKRNFKYLYWIIPCGMTGIITYILNNILYNEYILSVKMALTLICSLIGEILIVVLMALMLKAVSYYGEKDRRLLKFFYIFFGANAVLKALVAVMFDIIHGTFPVNSISIAITALIAVLLAVCLVKKEKSPLDKTAQFTVLPLAYVIIPNVVSLVRTIIGIVNTVI